MTFTLILDNKEEKLPIPSENYTVKDLANDLDIDLQVYVCKKNNQIVIEESDISKGDTLKFIQILYGG